MIARLRALSAAQAMLQHSRRLDTDGDGIGEFGLLTDLLSCGPADTRDGTLTEPLRALVTRELGPIAPDGSISDGYRLQLWLPAPDQKAHRGPGHGDTCGRDHDRAETAWCAYAWPAANGGPRLTFHIDASGEVFSTDAGGRYVGNDGPAVAAALPRGSGPFAARPQHGEVAGDGLVWLREP